MFLFLLWGPTPGKGMMLRINNSLSGKKEPFSPRVPGKVTMYVCGMTVYDDCHLGHARSAIVFDVIRRTLEYKGFEVKYVKNYTDVDDKIIERAHREGKDWKEISESFIDSYERDMSRLGVHPPSISPRATEHIGEMVGLIDRLISKGLAYSVEGNVYFAVKNSPSYGKLSKQKLEEMEAGVRVEIDQRKRSPFDFALWKGSKPGEPAWNSPWGMGRPGWHIECSAMAIKHLGETIDIHGGGKDLIFPHHENEIAQSEGYTDKEFSQCWVHHGFVTIDHEKMSKSLGNFFTVREIFEKSSQFSEEITAEVVRFYLLSTHYRSPIDFSDYSLGVAKKGLDNLYTLFQKLEELQEKKKESGDTKNGEWSRFQSEFDAAMDDDFNTAKAISVLQGLRAEVNIRITKGDPFNLSDTLSLFKRCGEILGLFRISPLRWRFHAWDSKKQIVVPESVEMNLTSAVPIVVNEEEVQSLIKEREEARRKKDWARSDVIRDQLAAARIAIEDRPDGTTRVKR